MVCLKSEECKRVTQVTLYKQQHVSTAKLFRYVLRVSDSLAPQTRPAYVKRTNNGKNAVSHV